MGFSDGLIKILNNVCDKFGIAIDWTSKNVVPYVMQLGNKVVQYELWTSIAWVAVGFILFLFGIFSVRYEFKHPEKFEGGGEGFGLFIFIVTLIIFLVTLLFQTGDIIACLTFPEKVMMDFLQGYMVN